MIWSSMWSVSIVSFHSEKGSSGHEPVATNEGVITQKPYRSGARFARLRSAGAGRECERRCEGQHRDHQRGTDEQARDNQGSARQRASQPGASISYRELGSTPPVGDDMDRHGQEPEDECRFVPGKPLLAKAEAEQPELDAGAEEGNREKHERDADQAQDDLGRAGSAIPGIAAVVTEKPVADAPQLEKHRRHEQKADQRVREQAGADP